MSQSVLELDPVIEAGAEGGAGEGRRGAPAASAAAEAAATGFDLALQRALQAEAAADGLAQGRDAAAWWRLALLQSFVTPLPHERAARLPLRCLPPAGLRPCNAVQALQLRIGTTLALAGGTQRLRAMAQCLPAALRADFHRFVSAMLPRLLDAATAMSPHAALEAAWTDARVNRRWQQFALQLDAEACAALLRARSTAAAGRCGENHALDPASDRKNRRWPSTSSTMPRPCSPQARGWPTVPA